MHVPLVYCTTCLLIALLVEYYYSHPLNTCTPLTTFSHLEVCIEMAYNQRLPANMSLLRLEQKHVIKAIWEGNERLLRPRRHVIYCMKHNDKFDHRVKNLIHQPGFGHFLMLTHIEINHHLIRFFPFNYPYFYYTF